MKSKIFVIALLAVALGFGGCGSKPTKSNECDILEFSVGSKSYTVANGTITAHYTKTGADKWPDMPATWPAEPTVKVSEKATYEPKGKVDLMDKEVVFTVTAEDGTQKTYKAKATKDQFYN